ncbi:MAG: hypothetical protein NTY02_16255 [Acidobacteria bacterium]|nr:hypothetical protein [Acidobacteriota bacterium]
MRFGVLGVSMALTWFLMISTVASALSAIVAARAAGRRPVERTPQTGMWLALRLMPSVVAALFLVFAFGPAYLRFEPRDATEQIGAPLLAAASTMMLLIGWSLGRALVASVRVAALQRRWLLKATRLAWPAGAMPIYVVDAPMPAVALVGVVRPRIFVSRPVFDALTPEEFRVVVAHETAHRARWDNLVRWLLLASPDLFRATPLGRAATTHWASAAETVADDDAVDGDARCAVALASALVKVAKLMPAMTRSPLPISALYDGGPLAGRIGRLLAPRAVRSSRRRIGAAIAALRIAAGTASLASAAFAFHRPVHEITEWIVRLAG